MNKLHTYMLPVAAGAFALMLSPIGEATAVAYSLIAIIIITGIIGLQALAKNNEASKVNGQQIVQELEQLQVQMENLVLATKKQTEKIKEETNEHTSKLVEETKQQFAKLVEVTDQQSTKLIEQTKQQTIQVAEETKQQTNTLVTILQTVYASLDTLQQTITAHKQNVTKQMSVLEDKVDEGNKVIENVSVLMIKELQVVNQQAEELITIQNALPNDLTALQDAITQNQQELVDGARTLENHLFDLKQVTESYYEQSTTSHNQVVEKIAQEFTGISATMKQETALLIEQAGKTADDAARQLARASEVVINIDKVNTELKKFNTVNNDKVNKQLTQLCDISSSLLQGVSQLTNSQSVERKQLLAIQKNLINKYAK